MTFRDDDRAASVQIGAILLFAMLVVAMAGWQAQVVPQDNADVEFTHSQRVTDDMQDVRNEIVSAPGRTSMRSVSVEMAPEYPPRTVFVNPGPPDGTLRTQGTTNENLNLTVDNVTAGGETGDFWDGSARAYNTGGLRYEPGYNVFTSAPDTVYENTVLYDVQDDGTTVTVAGQDLIEGRTVSLITMNGSLDRTTGGAYSVDFEALSSSTRTVTVTNSSGVDSNITISFASGQNASWWTDALRESGEFTDQGGHVVDVRKGSPATVGPFDNVTVELAGGETYVLEMAKVGVGSETEGTGKAYVIDVEGNNANVRKGNTKELVVEVRDRYNNPVTGVTVENNTTGTVLNGGSLDEERKTTGDDGQVTFEFTAGSSGVATIQLNISDDVTPADTELAIFTVAVTSSGGGGGGGKAWNTFWTSPPGSTTGFSCDGAGNCDLDAGKSSSVDLAMNTSTTSSGLAVEYALNNSSVGGLDPNSDLTDAQGASSTTFTASENGTTKIWVHSGGDGDLVNLTVSNVSGGAGDSTPPSVTVQQPNGGETIQGGSTYQIQWSASDSESGIASNSVLLEYSADGGTSWNTIASSEANDGAYDWNVPNIDSSNVLVRVSVDDQAGNTGSDKSDGTFTVDSTPPSVTVQQPNGGETINGGSTYQIQWSASDSLSGIASNSITLEYSADGGTSWNTIATGEANDGAYSWSVPTIDTSNALIRVTAVDNAGNAGSDISDSTFTIDSTPPSFDTLNATAINDGTGSGGGGSNDAEEVDVGYTTSDANAVDHVEFHVFDNSGTRVAYESRTVTDDSSYIFPLNSSVSVNGGSTVNIVAYVYDGAGNYQRCEGNIPDVGYANTITKASGDFTCTTG